MVANEDHVAEQGPPEAYKIKNVKKCNLCRPQLIIMFNTRYSRLFRINM